MTDQAAPPPAGTLPLAGIRILDLSAYIAGPYGCSLLADMGADIIKIESPDGDNLRKYPSTLEGESRAFLGVNRGKRGLCLDLKKPAGHEILLRLVAQADVLVHNFRPAVPPRLKIDFDTLHAVNPRLIYCSLTGYGQTGPLADKAGYDQVLQARTGICASQGTPERPEIVYGSAVDYYAASMLASGVSAALYQREKTGKGQHVTLSLLSSALAMQSARLVMAENEPRDISRDMRSGGITGIHPTREGHLYISANTPHFWRALCERIGDPALADDPRYDTVRKRAAAAGEIVPRVRQALLARSALEWETLFGTTVPCAAVRAVEDLFDDPQVQHLGYIVEQAHPRVGRYKGVARMIHFDGPAAQAPPRVAPELGADTITLLRELGYEPAHIETILADQAAYDPHAPRAADDPAPVA